MVRVVPPGGGEVVGDAPDRRVEILADGDAVHATWSRFGPSRPGADLHVHRRHTDVFVVLDGELEVLLGPEGRPVRAPAGSVARVPPLVVHGFRAGAEGATYLNLHAPGRGFADYLRALRDGGREVLADEPGGRVVVLADLPELWLAEVRAAGGEPAAPAPAPAPAPRPGDGGEALYVLEGELALTAAGAERRAVAGSWVQVPPGIPCAVAAAGGRPARFLRIRAPGAVP